ncbi:MAG: penicillin-insensitive murein endopeptidase [Pseudomonadota bacterium]
MAMRRLVPPMIAALLAAYVSIGAEAAERDAAKPAAAKATLGTPAAKPSDAKPATGALAPAAAKIAPVAAKTLFGAAKAPAPLAARAIGYYSRGCLSGARQLAIDGPAWQAMRLSRNRNWGHPDLVALVERLADEVKREDGWPGLLVGDLSQPRGGPMLTGHASHQIGLDADIWLTPMPDRRLSADERETLSATNMVVDNQLSVDTKAWTPAHVNVLRRAASYDAVERILVHPAIKKALCEAAGRDRKWLQKVRPYWGHNYHFHVRIGCPKGSANCREQSPPAADDGCGKELDDWFALVTAPPKPPPKVPPKPKPPPTLADLPAECRMVLESDAQAPKAAAAKTPAPGEAAIVPPVPKPAKRAVAGE